MHKAAHRALAVVCSLVTLSLPASAQELALDWKSGYSWKYQWVDLWKKEQVGTVERVVGEQTAEGFRSVYHGKSRVLDELVKPDGTVLRSLDGLSGAPAPFAIAEVRLPHKEGATWQYVEYWPSQEVAGAVANHVNCEAKASEQVEVPLGKFKAQRVDCRGVWRSPAGGSGRTELTTWYSSDLKWLVLWRSKAWVGSSLQRQEEFRLFETTVPRP